MMVHNELSVAVESKHLRILQYDRVFFMSVDANNNNNEMEAFILNAF